MIELAVLQPYMNKEIVIQKVVELLKQRVQGIERSIQQALQDAREAPSAMESHSDTSRSEKQRLAANFEQDKTKLAHVMKFVRTIDSSRALATVQNGSLIQAQENETITWYFMIPAQGGDHLTINNEVLITLSPDSLIGKSFMGKKQNDTVKFQSPKEIRTITIKQIL